MRIFLRDSVTIQRATPATSAAGDVTETFASSSTGVLCDIQPLSGYYRSQEEGKASPSTHRGFFGSGTDVRDGDRIVNGSKTYLVTFVSNFRHHLEANLAEIVP